jgi:hypothetical protein
MSIGCERTKVNKEVLYGKDRKKEESQSYKSKETICLYLFSLWQGSKDPFSSLFTREG